MSSLCWEWYPWTWLSAVWTPGSRKQARYPSSLFGHRRPKGLIWITASTDVEPSQSPSVWQTPIWLLLVRTSPRRAHPFLTFPPGSTHDKNCTYPLAPRRLDRKATMNAFGCLVGARMGSRWEGATVCCFRNSNQNGSGLVLL